LGFYCNDNQGIILVYVRFEVLTVAGVEDYFLKKVWEVEMVGPLKMTPDPRTK